MISELAKKEIPKKTPEEIISYLKGLGSNINNEMHEFVIEGTLTQDSILALINIGYEVGFTEMNGKVIITTLNGVDKFGKTSHEYDEYIDRSLTSRLNAHTHNKREDGLIFDGISFPDIIVSFDVSESTSLLVFHQKGIIRYQKPKRNPVTQESITNGRDIGQAIKDFSIQIGARFVFFPDYLPYLTEVTTPYERLKLARNFAIKSGMILKDVKWDDTDEVNDLLSILNLER